MADWKKLARDLLLADDRIDDRETGLIRQELLAERRIDDIELEFLLEVKKGANVVVPSFNVLVHECIKIAILEDGVITPMEAEWLRRYLLSDGQISPPEKKLIEELKAGAKKTCPEFEALYQKCRSA
jgi:hypothetical protein